MIHCFGSAVWQAGGESPAAQGGCRSSQQSWHKEGHWHRAGWHAVDRLPVAPLVPVEQAGTPAVSTH